MNPTGGSRIRTTSHVKNTRGSYLSRNSMISRAMMSKTTITMTRSEMMLVYESNVSTSGDQSKS